MTSLRQRFENVLAELTIIRQALDKSNNSPPCCIILYPDGRISCDVVAPVKKEQFYKECEKCRSKMKKIIKKFI